MDRPELVYADKDIPIILKLVLLKCNKFSYRYILKQDTSLFYIADQQYHEGTVPAGTILSETTRSGTRPSVTMSFKD